MAGGGVKVEEERDLRSSLADDLKFLSDIVEIDLEFERTVIG